MTWGKLVCPWSYDRRNGQAIACPCHPFKKVRHVTQGVTTHWNWEPMSEADTYKAQREKKRDALIELGVDPYGRRFTGVAAIADVRAQAEPLDIEEGQRSELTARLAGRISLLRMMGKLAFVTVRDESGKIQLGLSKSDLAEQWPIIKKLDLGDIIGAEGVVGRTKTGELTLWVSHLTVLSKSLLPPPEKWHGLTDVDLRYRQRYVDLFSNPQVREVFRQRSQIIQALRSCLLELGYWEVDTPFFSPSTAEQPPARLRRITTHSTWTCFCASVRSCISSGCLWEESTAFSRSARNFRNEGISTKHNPEFTMVELYEAYADYHVMMERVEQMVAAAFNASTREFIRGDLPRLKKKFSGFRRRKRRKKLRPMATKITWEAYRQASAGIAEEN